MSRRRILRVVISRVGSDNMIIKKNKAPKLIASGLVDL